MNIYLDNNIFIYIEEKKLTVGDIENLIGNKINKIFFSASHIQETLEIKGGNKEQRIERINKRLKTIETITNQCYINENLKNEVFEYKESPFNVIKTISEISFAQNAIRGLVNLISEEQKLEIQKLLDVNSKKLNNYSPSEVIEHLSKKLTPFGNDFTFLKMIEIGISQHPNGHTFGRSNRIAAIFELLDMLGYWKDEVNDKSNYARLWDSSHTFYASYCDYFISNDKRTVNKAKVVNEIYGIKTQVLMPKNIC